MSKDKEAKDTGRRDKKQNLIPKKKASQHGEEQLPLSILQGKRSKEVE